MWKKSLPLYQIAWGVLISWVISGKIWIWFEVRIDICLVLLSPFTWPIWLEQHIRILTISSYIPITCIYIFVGFYSFVQNQSNQPAGVSSTDKIILPFYPPLPLTFQSSTPPFIFCTIYIQQHGWSHYLHLHHVQQ